MVLMVIGMLVVIGRQEAASRKLLLSFCCLIGAINCTSSGTRPYVFGRFLVSRTTYLFA